MRRLCLHSKGTLMPNRFRTNSAEVSHRLFRRATLVCRFSRVLCAGAFRFRHVAVLWDVALCRVACAYPPFVLCVCRSLDLYACRLPDLLCVLRLSVCLNGYIVGTIRRSYIRDSFGSTDCNHPVILLRKMSPLQRRGIRVPLLRRGARRAGW